MHCVGINGTDIDDTGEVRTLLRGFGTRTREAEDHVLSGKRPAVVEPDALTQSELPGQRVDRPPRHRQVGYLFQVRVITHQPFVNLTVLSDGRHLVDRVRIEGERTAHARPAHHIVGRGGSGNASRNADCQCGDRSFEC